MVVSLTWYLMWRIPIEQGNYIICSCEWAASSHEMTSSMPKREHFRRRKKSKITRLRHNASYKQYLKLRGLLKCAVCGFFDPLTLPYFLIEVHHCIRVCDGGQIESHDNSLPLCPNHHNLADRLSARHKDMVITKEVMVSLIRQHEFERDRHIERLKRNGY